MGLTRWLISRMETSEIESQVNRLYLREQTGWLQERMLRLLTEELAKREDSESYRGAVE